MKAGRLITKNMKLICSIPIAMKECLCEQIKKASGQVVDIFMQVVPLGKIRTLKPHTAGKKTD